MAEQEQQRTHLCVCVTVEGLEALQPDAGLGVQVGVAVVGRRQAEQPPHPGPQAPGLQAAPRVTEGQVGRHVPHRGGPGAGRRASHRHHGHRSGLPEEGEGEGDEQCWSNVFHFFFFYLLFY